MSQLVESLSFLSVAFYKMGKWLDEKIEEYKVSRKIDLTIKELSALTDKELRDIGISRGMIRSVAEGAYRD